MIARLALAYALIALLAWPAAPIAPVVPRQVAMQIWPLYEHGTGLRAGDLNDDGWLDVAMGTNTSRLRIWLQDPVCHELSEQIDMPTVDYPADLAIGDLDGDGDDDIAIVGQGAWAGTDYGGLLRIIYQEADGLATTPLSYTLGIHPRRVSIGDLSSDGLPDIVVSSDHNLDVLFQQPGGTFSPVIVDEPRFVYPYEVAIADLNNDGRNDVALQGMSANPNVAVYMQRPDGAGLDPGILIPAFSGDKDGFGMTAGDVSGDGLADIIVSQSYNSPQAAVAVIPQLAGGGFGQPATVSTYDLPTSPTLADWNDDGRQDVVVLNNGYGAFTVHLQLPAGGLGAAIIYPAAEVQAIFYRGIDVRDVTGDGRPDVAHASYNQGWALITEGALPDCPEPPPPPRATVPDFIVHVQGQSDGLYHEDIVAGDVNGDGRQDFVAIEQEYTSFDPYVRLIPQNPDGSFSLGDTILIRDVLPYSVEVRGLSAGDLNGDGLLDVSVATEYSDTIVVAYQQPGGAFNRVPVAVDSERYQTYIADWTGDGRDDLGVIADGWFVLAQQPDGTLGPPVRHLAGEIGATILSTTGDWNGDGLLDLAAWWRPYPTLIYPFDALRLILQQPDGSFQVQSAPAMAPTDLQMGDVTGDGRTDLVLSIDGNAPTGVLWIIPQQPDGSMGNRILIGAPDYERPGGLALNDLNGDGRTDVLCMNAWFYFSAFTQNAAGRLDPPVFYYGLNTYNNYYAHRVASIDATRDGIPEVIGVSSPEQCLVFLKPSRFLSYLPLAVKNRR